MQLTGYFYRDDQYVYAICDQLPLVIPGTDEDAALESMSTSFAMYREMLEKRGEWEEVVTEFNIQILGPRKARQSRFTLKIDKRIGGSSDIPIIELSG